jgi:flagellar basal-body rod modification protein FlgD
MIGVKGGTQTWSNSPQRTDFKSDGTQNLSASDRGKVLGGDESVGDLLNKVADPNYVDASKKMRTVGNNQLGKDAFMSLLLTQMKNQDPTNPMKSHEMAAQLAQFTSLEKLNNINDGINALHKDQQPSRNFEALSFIGRTIKTDNSKLSRLDKDSQQELRFTLPADARTLTLQIKDAAGTPVRTLEYKNMKVGKNSLMWNGVNDDGSTAPPGEYTVSYEAIGSNGHKLAVETKTEGVISGVNFTAHGPQLLVGRQAIDLADVKSISETQPGPSAASGLSVPVSPAPSPGAPNSQSVPAIPAPGAASSASAGEPASASAPAHAGRMFPITGADSVPAKGPRMAQVKPESKPDSVKRAKLENGNLNDAAMAQGLINKLNKEGAKAGMG